MSSGRRRRRYWVELSSNIVGECCISLLRLGALPRFRVTEHAASALFLPSSPCSRRRRRSWKAAQPTGKRPGGGTGRKRRQREDKRGEAVTCCTDQRVARCDFNGGSGVSCRIVRSRGAMSPKGGTGNRSGGARGRRRLGRKWGMRARGRNRERRGC